MSNKLKIYSTLFVIAFIAVGFSNSFLFRSMGWSPAPDNKMEFAEMPAEYMTIDTLADGETVSTGHSYYSYELNVHSWSRPDNKVLLSTAQGQTYMVNMKKIEIDIPASRGGFHFPYYNLETTGYLLSFVYLYELIVSYIITQYFIANIHLADHSIIFVNECNSMYLLTGLALMIISQIILMGKDLKEEQELTI